jgi:hypothetical protein
LMSGGRKEDAVGRPTTLPANGNLVTICREYSPLSALSSQL